MKLQDIDLLKLMPNFMRSEKDIAALSEVVSEVLQPLAAQIDRLSTWGYLSELNGEELDSLADELNVFWYDKKFTDDQKRTLIASSDRIFMKLGTAEAVENVVSDIYGPSTVEEFFDYEGSPHYFRIQVQDPDNMTVENEAKLLQFIEKIKRKTQWLEAIQHEAMLSIPLYTGLSVATHDNTFITFDTWHDNRYGLVCSGTSAVIKLEDHVYLEI